jgi:hypothetical protein
MSTYSPTLVHRWNRTTCDAIYFARLGPTMAARAAATVHTAMYDAWTAYNGSAEFSTTTGNWLKRPKPECVRVNREKAYSYAAFRALNDLLWCALPPEKKGMFRELMCELGHDPDDQSLDITKPQGIGNLSARLVIEQRHGDGSNQKGTLAEGHYTDYTGYRPVNSPDKVSDIYRWQPLWKKDGTAQAFLTPHWGAMQPFALPTAHAFRPSPPISGNTRMFYEQVTDVIRISECLTDREKMIAEYFAGMHDDIVASAGKKFEGQWTVPPAQLFEVVRFVSEKRKNQNARDIKLFFLAANALLDVSIAVWECKRYYDYVRPVTAVRELFGGKCIEAWAGPCKGTQQIDGRNWNTYIPTPPFAEYVSGHSTFSSATCEVIAKFFEATEAYLPSNELGMSKTFTPCSSKVEPNCTPSEEITLKWDKLEDFVEGAGMSRRYGGIHFEDGDLNGRRLGCEIAGCVWEKAMYYFAECP